MQYWKSLEITVFKLNKTTVGMFILQLSVSAIMLYFCDLCFVFSLIELSFRCIMFAILHVVEHRLILINQFRELVKEYLTNKNKYP